MAKPIQIKLGEKTFHIKPFTIGQCEELGFGVSAKPEADPQQEVKRVAAHYKEVLLLALAGNSDITPDNYQNLVFTIRERNEAVTAILRHAGLLPAEKTLQELRAELAALEKTIAVKEEQQKNGMGEARAEAA